MTYVPHTPSVQKFIDENPFPKNGTEINNRLVAAIRDPRLADKKQDNLHLLLKNNARLIYMIHQQFSYGMELADVMSFVYQGLVKAVNNFNPKFNKRFYLYAVHVIRGEMQFYHQYHDELVHIPVTHQRRTNKKTGAETGIKPSYEPLAEHLEFSSQQEDNSRSGDLDKLITLYVDKNDLSAQEKSDLCFLKKSRKLNYVEIAATCDQSDSNIRCRVIVMGDKLRAFSKMLNDDDTSK